MKFAYDYYTIEVPGDAYETNEDVLDAAIYEARERAALYVNPCEWTAEIVSGQIGDWVITVKVRRKRRRRQRVACLPHY